jgi:hypothetical protein
MSHAKNIYIIEKYKKKFTEIIEILDDYSDPRLHQYSEKISTTSDEKIIRQHKAFEEKIRENYKKTFDILFNEISLYLKAQKLLKNAYHQRHPSSKDKFFEVTEEISFLIDQKFDLTSEQNFFSELEMEKEKTKSFELREINKLNEDQDYNSSFKDLDLAKEKTLVCNLEELKKKS